jgi:hypothetical protein
MRFPCDPEQMSCRISDDGKSITFTPCGVTSFHAKDVANRYCARCNRFMEDVEEMRGSRLIRAVSSDRGKLISTNANRASHYS